ncbi:thioredoxin domain-containing protein [Blastopirellula marina]|uniref:Thioredoxin domain-containing protein n=1 Tax=Blastopirellula marina TaxID=124 RepID=A0A2S8FH92_9BACT|nr:thioredoxin domain-containing protein [Blastopirellula marina]PQO31523.1 thioredoxin domain-containing protein [Blastopirellula marina]PTL42829.1 thioredoxin domain-containing protein [Blastopirellula marina]
MPNRLEHESSPYLLQHANNPVDWFPWGEEALEVARDQQKPIFLSIGYSACHWCHVMEHESFESQEIADYLNAHFVCIKVDREERPDLDQIYMNAVQLLTGHGGWPMSVFLTPELKPFFGGTYWPPTASRGMPGFDQVLRAVIDAWTNRREMAQQQSEILTERLQSIGAGAAESTEIPPGRIGMAVRQMEQSFDERHGGFGQAPKFPHTMNVDLLLRNYVETRNEHSLKIVAITLDKMSRGGIYDHLGGGFARYSVDAKWLVPHFEKMLYDNALLVSNYVDAFRLTKFPRYAQVVRETCDYILRDMTDELGGFHSTEDADSEGEEGKFYVWEPHEIHQLLGDETIAQRFCYVYDVTESGNFEGHSILNLKQPLAQFAEELQTSEEELAEEMANGRQVLFNARYDRVRPGKDDKILASWNGLMIEALAKAGAALGEPRYLAAATQAAKFVLEKMTDANGRLLHTYRHGKAKLPAYLDDYSYLASAMFALYEATFDATWLDECHRLMQVAIEHFYDQEEGGFFYTADDHEALIARNKDFYDNSIPSGNGMAALVLAKLGKLIGDNELLRLAEATVVAGADVLQKHPLAAGQLLIAYDFLQNPGKQVVLAVESDDPSLPAIVGQLHSQYLPRTLLAVQVGDTQPSGLLQSLLEGKKPQAGEPTIYACENFQCQAPVSAASYLSS